MAYQIAGLGDADCIVAGQEELDRKEVVLGGNAIDLAAEEVPHNAVVGLVRLGFGVMDAVSNVGFDVGATDELDGERPAFPLGELELILELVPRRFEVGLEGVV